MISRRIWSLALTLCTERFFCFSSNLSFQLKDLLDLCKIFQYKEILQYAKELGKEVSITDYLIWGGFPQRFEFNSEEAQRRYDLTHNMENIVYNELIYMGYHVYVYNNAGKEIDFLAEKGNKQYYIQVAYSVAEDKTYRREFDAFKGIDSLSRKIIITNDEIDYSTSAVEHIKLKDFLLMDTLER